MGHRILVILAFGKKQRDLKIKTEAGVFEMCFQFFPLCQASE